ncbi:MAG: hypothetical protein R6X18_09290 [Chloroflexota bacterium]
MCNHHSVLQEGQLAGYTILRPCRTCYKFSPLFADDASSAEALFRVSAGRLDEGTPFYLYVPVKNLPAA